MLTDDIRTQRFKECIERTVRKGDVVIDLGTGTGIMAIWAAKAGAKKVYAFEEADVADVAKAVIADNCLQNVIEVLRANSMDINISEQADVLIAELVGHFFFEEGIVEYVADVRDRLLRPNGKVIPSDVSVYLAPVELGDSFREIHFWREWSEPTLKAVCHSAANTAYVEWLEPSCLLAREVVAFHLDSSCWSKKVMEAKLESTIERKGFLDAYAGWFDLNLGSNIHIATGPSDPRTHWQQCVFPLERPVQVSPGDRVQLQMQIQPFFPGCRWTWRISLSDRNGWYEEHDFAITYGMGSRLLNERF